MADDDKKNGGKDADAPQSTADRMRADAEMKQAQRERAAQMSPPDQATTDTSMPLQPAAAGRDGRRGPRDMPGSNYSVHERRLRDWEMPKSDVLGDTAVHNAGNSGPVALEPEYPHAVTRAPLPGGLMEPYINTREDLDGIAPEPTNPGLVAHTGSGSGLSAHEDAATHHFRLRMGELRNVARDLDHRMIADGGLRRLALGIKNLFGFGDDDEDQNVSLTGRDDTPWRDGGRQRRRAETDEQMRAAISGTGESREERRQEPDAARPAEVDPNANR